MSNSKASHESVLLVFDFDRSLIDTDSDHAVLEMDAEMYNTVMANRGKDGIPKQWTDLMDYCLGLLREAGFTKQDLVRTLRAIKLDPDMIIGLRLGESHGAHFAILSDANTFYIREILEESEVDDLFDVIHTNPAEFDAEGRLRINRLVPKGERHGCAQPCAENLCKGRILRAMIDKHNYRRVAYVGDSTNDFCPAMELRKGDICLARSGMALEKLLLAKQERVRCDVVVWESYADILSCFKTIFS